VDRICFLFRLLFWSSSCASSELPKVKPTPNPHPCYGCLLCAHSCIDAMRFIIVSMWCGCSCSDPVRMLLFHWDADVLVLILCGCSCSIMCGCYSFILCGCFACTHLTWVGDDVQCTGRLVQSSSRII
jgi:hypothetical protein